jgi:hypothetical protein
MVSTGLQTPALFLWVPSCPRAFKLWNCLDQVKKKGTRKPTPHQLIKDARLVKIFLRFHVYLKKIITA